MQPHDKPLDLTGRTAVITGAAGGISAAISRRLADAGADVHLIDIDASALDAIVDQLRTAGLSAQGWTVDLRRQDSIDEFFTAFSAEAHTPRIWVNNAGIAPRRPVLSISAADWDDVLNLNLRAAYLAASRAAAAMIERRCPA